MTEEDRSAGEGRHPLPGSDEARRDEIPEHLVREKGIGDDDVEAVQPAAAPVGPDGESYGEGADRSSVEQVDDGPRR